MKKKNFPLILFAAIIILIQTLPLLASDISVKLLLEKQEAAIGEPIALQIKIQGANSAEEPDLTGIDAFHIQPRGGQSSSSTQVTSINGKWEKITNLGYIFNYTITPKQAGNLTIPTIAVQIEGQTYQTTPLTIKVQAPQETDEFKLRVFLSSSKSYAGEPLTMTTTWFVGKDVNNFEFQMPILDDPRFELIPQKAIIQGPSQELIKIPLGDQSIDAVKGKGQLEGREFLTLTFHHLLIAKEHGHVTIPQTTVVCQTLSGYRQSRRQSPFGGFDDFFGNSREAIYQTLVIPANTPGLNVMPLPEESKPASFSGLVGDYSIEAEADPLEVNIGDPITLKVTITGPFAHEANLPNLSYFLPESSFKIPQEISPGEINDSQKLFTQTIRVKDENITEIPPLELVFFDPVKKQYTKSATAAIPLTVHSARVVTAIDAEGLALQNTKKELTEMSRGLAVNYEGHDVLVNQQGKDISKVMLFLLLPPAFFVLTAILSFMRKHREQLSPLIQSKKALAKLEKTINNPALSGESLTLSFKIYLGEKTQKKPGSMTFTDMEGPLRKIKAPESVSRELKELFDIFERWHYSGSDNADEDLGPVKAKILSVARKLETHFS